MKISKKNYLKSEFFGQNNLFLGQKVRKKVRNSSEISETGFSECSEISEIWKFRTF